jgi:two-component system nitrogen regulation response regulator NtrX
MVDYYIESLSLEYNRPRFQLGNATRQQLRQYTWPGNVRELRAYIERLYATETVPLPPGCFGWEDGYGHDWLGEQTEPPLEAAPGRITQIDATPVIQSLAQMEREAIRRALAYSRWNRTEAARLLAIHRSTLIRKIRHHDIRPEQ